MKSTLARSFAPALALAAAFYALPVSAVVYTVNQIDYRNPVTGAIAKFTELWGNNNGGKVVGGASEDDPTGAPGLFNFAYEPSSGLFTRPPLPAGFDGVTRSIGAISINDLGVTAGATGEPTGQRGFILNGGIWATRALPPFACRLGSVTTNSSWWSATRHST